MSKVTSAQQAAWQNISLKCYADQAIWFLNGFYFLFFGFVVNVYFSGFWDELQGEAENVWGWVELFSFVTFVFVVLIL